MTDLLTLARKTIPHGDHTKELNLLAQQFNQHGRGLRKNQSAVTTGLNELNPAQHSLAYAWFLDAEIANNSGKQINQQQANQLIQYCHSFFSQFQAWQIHEGKIWSIVWAIAREFYHISMSHRREAAPLSSLRRTCQILDTVIPHALTSIHTHFVMLSVRAKHYRAASSVVNRPIYSIVPHTSLNTVDLLNFFYFAGLIHSANKQWTQAYDSFHMCLSVPGNAVSAIQVAAHKKLILTSIISKHELPEFSQRTHSANLKNSLEHSNQVYLDLAKAFDKQLSNQSASTTRQSSSASSSSSTQTIQSSLLNHPANLTETLNHDRCLGLALELDKHLFETRIQRLTRTYITLELSEMAKIVGASSLSHLEATVNRLINSCVIGARINHMTGLCEFVDQQETAEFVQLQTKHLQDQITELCNVLQALQQKQQQIERNPMYIAKQLLSQQGDDRPTPVHYSRMGASNEDFELNAAIAESLRAS